MTGLYVRHYALYHTDSVQITPFVPLFYPLYFC